MFIIVQDGQYLLEKKKRKVVTIQNKNSLALNKYGEQFFLLSSLLSYYSVLKFV